MKDRINHNYDAAIAFYQQRELNLLKSKVGNNPVYGMTEEQMVAYCKVILEAIFSQINQDFNTGSAGLASGTKVNASGNSYKTSRGKFRKMTLADLYQLADHFNTNTGINMSAATLAQIFPKDKNNRYGDAGTPFYSALGFVKEEIINNFNVRSEEIVEEGAEQIFYSLLNMIQKDGARLGKEITSKASASRGAGKPIGIDYGSANIKGNGDITEVPFNLFADLSTEDTRASRNQQFNYDLQLNNFLDQYLNDPTLINTWGIQVKAYNDQKTISYRIYSSLQKALNTNYKIGDPP